METEKISSLKLRAVGLAVEIRALRKWNPRFQTYTSCYIFVDKFGDAIQAIAQGAKDQKFVESILQLGKCYRVEGYACVEPNKYVNALSHPVNMRIGSATSITPIADTPNLPLQYFNFCDRETLESMCNKDKNITDYYGILQGRFEDKNKRDGSPFVTFNLIDASNQQISVALWKEVALAADRFDRQTIENAERPAVIAVTAMKVTKFSEKPQLTSTFGTFVFLNPQNPATESLLNSHRNEDLNSETVIDIAGLLEKQNSELSGKTFICHATITEIVPTTDWYCDECPVCSYDIFLCGNNWWCPTHGNFESAKHTYQITAIISDTSADLQITISDEPAAQIIGIECSELRVIDACDNKIRTPPQIEAMKGKTMAFHIQAHKEIHTGIIRATVNKISNPQRPSNEQTTEIQATTKPTAQEPTKTPPTPDATTPNTTKKQTITGKRLNFSTPDTGSDGSKRQHSK